MNKESERYLTKVEIPISVILETIFSDDNYDVETLSRWALKYGFVDLIKEDGDKLGYYKLQDDYTKQSFYVWLSKEERKQYDYEDYLLDKIDQLTNNWNELEEWLKELQKLYEGNEFQNNAKFCITVDQALDKMKEIKEKNNE